MSAHIDYGRLARTHREKAAVYRAKAYERGATSWGRAAAELATSFDIVADRCETLHAQGVKVLTLAEIERRRAGGAA